MTYFESFRFDQGYTYVIDKDGNEFLFCDQIAINRIIMNIETKELDVEIGISQIEGSVATFTCPRSEVISSPFELLTKYGLSLAKSHVNEVTVTEILLETELEAELCYCHKSLGFKVINGKTYFLSKNAIPNQLKSSYYRKDYLTSCGTFNEWCVGFRKLLPDNPYLLPAIAMGITAPIASILTISNMLDETLIWSLVGMSSKGKTTMLMAAASVWGLPNNHGILGAMNGTDNYIITSIANQNGFPVFFDETTAKRSQDFTKLIYDIGLSREGGRCRADGTEREPRTWSGAVITTGERSMLDSSLGYGGMHARVIEFDAQWTKDAESSEAIKNLALSQFGTAYVPIVKKLMKLGNDAVVEGCKRCMDELKKLFNPTTGIEERITKKLGVLLFACEIISQTCNLSIKREILLEFMQAVFRNNAPESDIINNCYNSFLEYVSTHAQQFPASYTSASHLKYGVRAVNNNRDCIWVMNDFFKRFLKDRGLTDTAETLRIMHERHMIARVYDRFRIQRTVDDHKTLCLCVYLNNDPEIKTQKVTYKTITKEYVNPLLQNQNLCRSDIQ